MKRNRFTSLLCLVLLGLAAGGCAVADTGAFVRLQEDMEALKREVAAGRTAVGAIPSGGGPGESELASFQRNLADLASESDRMKADILAVTASNDETKVEMQSEVSRLNATTAELREAVQEMRAMRRRLRELTEKGERGPEAGPPATAPLTPGAGISSPDGMYDYALGLIKNGDTQKGREVLNSFAAKYPDHRLMQNVFYWKGETFYAEKDYESAILSFQDVIDRFPQGEKAPDAMLKQGLAFHAMRDNKNARILYQLLLSKYPNSPAADKARQKLAELR